MITNFNKFSVLIRNSAAVFFIALFIFTSCGKKPVIEEITAKPKTYKVEDISFTFNFIPAVKDVTVGHKDFAVNQPHKVSLPNYYMGETEVTQELWTKVMGNNPSVFQGEKYKPFEGDVQEKRPVDSVTWFDCIVFCNKLTAMTELTESECVYRNKDDNAVYTEVHAKDKKEPVMDMSKKGFRLPTEAEWEVAALGGKQDRWSGTDDEEKLEEYAWYADNSTSKTHEVKKRKPNAYGLYDMSGNVSEWCWDRTGDNLTTPEGGDDPTGIPTGGYRAWRCGSYATKASVCRPTYRNSYEPGYKTLGVGLRLACR